MPVSVNEIHRTAFDGCPRLTIVGDPGSYAAEYEESRDKSNVAQAESQDINGNAGESGGLAFAEGLFGGSAGGASTDSGKVMGQSSIVGGSAFVFMDDSQSRVLSGNPVPAEQEGGAEEMASGSGFRK